MSSRYHIDSAYNSEDDAPVSIEISTSSRRPIQTSAIAEWRERARAAPRASRSHRHEHGSQHSSQAALSSDSGEDSSPQRKNPGAAFANLKYLVRSFLKARPRERSGRDRSRTREENKESFFPLPKLTFLIDQPDDLVCQICQETPLRMARDSASADDATPVILPCGHVGCHFCVSHWLENSKSCPFCRKEMTHTGCRHPVQPRLLAHDTIGIIPKTLACGGAVGFNCGKCEAREQRAKALRKMKDAADKYKTARKDAEKLGTDDAKEAAASAGRAFERLAKNHAVDVIYAAHSNW
ncbi:hypothetical protein F4778DRAFT_718014 [Xylariomycetidae sp. FL2044]|nr:hypothetical protein F4778DRAFT_718014 [Xylariomycetidae sp. FL2044]